MKTLKFREKLSKLILNNKKNKTWRLFDDKNLTEKDKVELIIWETGEKFAKAILTNIKEKSFKELTKKDFEGHEKYKSKKEMLKEYEKYYKQPINMETKIKIIEFQIIK